MNWEIWACLTGLPVIGVALWFCVPRLLRLWEARRFGRGGIPIPVGFRPAVPLSPGSEPTSPVVDIPGSGTTATELLPFPGAAAVVGSFSLGATDTPHNTLRRTTFTVPPVSLNR